MHLCKKVLRISALIVFMCALFCCKEPDSKSRPIQKIDPILFNSATELTDAIRRGEITALDLLDRYLSSIERNNGSINAVVALTVDAARKRAAEADEALARNEIWGPLHGLPMTVKDAFEVAGMPATSGDPKLKSYIPEHNALAVQRLMDAGAIIFGKTNVPYRCLDFQSFNKIYGTTNNPWSLATTPGGSSGGSAAALSAGFTPLELGSDLGGSIRIPAHYTGVFGHKPTFGIIPRHGHISPFPGSISPELMPSIPLGVVGPLARSAEDLELSLMILTTPGRSNDRGIIPELLPPRKKRFKDYRVAVWFTDNSPAAEIDTGVLALLQKTVEKIRNTGLEVDENARPNIQLWETIHLRAEIRNEIMTGALPLNEQLVSRQKNQQSKWAAFFDRYDVLLTPVAPTVAFPHNHREPLTRRRLDINGKKKPYLDNLTWVSMAIVSGLPATVVPIGLCESGLPAGIQIIGARLEDRTTISFAQGLSDLVGGFKSPPNFTK
jgi:amidase